LGAKLRQIAGVCLVLDAGAGLAVEVDLANEAEHWFDTAAKRLHCIPWEAETGLRWAELLAKLRSLGRAMPVKDSLIATTALVTISS
jgi:predicted nucleic acid-binding protein